MSELLGGRITNADEDEVEAELAALEEEATAAKESTAAARLPEVPTTDLPEAVGPAKEPAASGTRQAAKAKQPEGRQLVAA